MVAARHASLKAGHLRADRRRGGAFAVFGARPRPDARLPRRRLRRGYLRQLSAAAVVEARTLALASLDISVGGAGGGEHDLQDARSQAADP